MVKIRIKSILVSIVLFVFLMNTAYAARQALEFSDVDVKVGSKTSKNLRDRDTINEEAEPGDNVEFRIEIKNNFTSVENLEIEDITVDATIEGIDDGDDLDEEISSDFNLRAGRDKRVTLKFQVPLEVEEDEFDVIIRAEGDDENSTNQEIEMRLKLEVEKESHLLKITKISLRPSEVSCNRKNVQLSTTVINIGNEDEEDVTLQVSNTDLEINIEENVGELTAEPNEDESRISKVYRFNAPEDAEAGSYPITFIALYDDNRRKAEETAELTISDCPTAKPNQGENNSIEEDKEEEEVKVITPPPTTGKTIAPVVQPETPQNTIVTQESFLKSNTFIVGIIITEVIAVIVGIILVASLFRKKA